MLVNTEKWLHKQQQVARLGFAQLQGPLGRSASDGKLTHILSQSFESLLCCLFLHHSVAEIQQKVQIHRVVLSLTEYQLEWNWFIWSKTSIKRSRFYFMFAHSWVILDNNSKNEIENITLYWDFLGEVGMGLFGSLCSFYFYFFNTFHYPGLD